MTVATTTSSIPGVVTALLEKFHGLSWPTLIGTQDRTVYVFDGIAGPNAPDNYVMVGVDSPAVVGTQVWASLGALKKEDEYDVTCACSSYVGGDDNLGQMGMSDAQLSARTNAFAMFAVIETALRNDLRLLGVSDPPNVQWLEVGPRIEVEQTTDDDPEAEKGRICTVKFDVHIHARIDK